MTEISSKLFMSLLGTYVITRVIALILRKSEVRPTVASTIAAISTFIVLSGLWVGTPYAASAARYYGVSTAVCLAFDLYRLRKPASVRVSSDGGEG